jgi:hypothetical protein
LRTASFNAAPEVEFSRRRVAEPLREVRVCQLTTPGSKEAAALADARLCVAFAVKGPNA